VQALAPEEPAVPTRLMSLVRKELVRPDTPLLPGDDAFRFRHLLIRDAAYDALPKAERADLHERFALWLEEHGADLVELDEILGYHLEQAWIYRRELGQDADETLGARAREHLVAAGHRAILRGDNAAARGLLERGARLGPKDRIDQVEFELVDVEFGLNMEDARRRAHALVERATAAGDDTARLTAEVLEGQVRAWTDPEGAAARLKESADELVRVAEESGDDYALYVANFGLVVFCHMRCLFDDSLDYIEQCSAAGRRLGLRHLDRANIRYGGSAREFGTRVSLAETLEWFDGLQATGVRDAGLYLNRIGALGLTGRFDEARAVVAEASAAFEERGAVVPLALLKGLLVPEVENLAQNPEAGIEVGEEGCAMLEQVGDKGWLSTASAELAESYVQLGDLDRAYELTVRSEELGASDDMANEERWRLARAKVLARRGEFDAAERLAREALAISEQTQHLDAHSQMTLGEVLERSGRADEAVEWYRRAHEGFAKKGIVPLAEETQRSLDSLLELD
jgi:tetratricopeptide (TPR) repeat protein